MCRYGHTATVLPGGEQVLVTGGQGDDYTVLSSVELLIAAGWRSLAPMETSRCVVLGLYGMGILLAT